MDGHNGTSLWLDKAEAMGPDSDLAEAVGLAGHCPAAFRGSADYGWFLGTCAGRCVEMCRRLSVLRSPEYRTVRRIRFAIEELMEDWTILPPPIMMTMLSTRRPMDLLIFLEAWPRRLLGYRPFYIGCLMGLYAENAPGTDDWGSDEVSRMRAVLETQRKASGDVRLF